MKIRTIKSRVYARLGKLEPIVPSLFNVYQVKDNAAVKIGVPLSVAQELIAKAKRQKRASLYSLAA